MLYDWRIRRFTPIKEEKKAHPGFLHLFPFQAFEFG